MRKNASLLLLFLTLTACGKKGHLIYPDQTLPASVKQLSASQSGTGILVRFAPPERNIAGKRLDTPVAGYRVYRTASRFEPRKECTSCPSGEQSVFTLPVAGAEPVSEGGHHHFFDKETEEGRWYTYSVAPLVGNDTEGKRSGEVSVIKVRLPDPPVLNISSTIGSISVGIGKPADTDGAHPHKYLIYRRILAAPGEPGRETLVGEITDNGQRFVDMMAAPETTYEYFARTVIQIPASGDVTGNASTPVQARLPE